MRDAVCVQKSKIGCVPCHLRRSYQLDSSCPCCFCRDVGVHTPGGCWLAPSAAALKSASSFNAFPLSFAAAAAAAPFALLFLACAAAAICRSLTVDPSDRESSAAGRFFAGGIAPEVWIRELCSRSRVAIAVERVTWNLRVCPASQLSSKCNAHSEVGVFELGTCRLGHATHRANLFARRRRHVQGSCSMGAVRSCHRTLPT